MKTMLARCWVRVLGRAKGACAAAQLQPNSAAASDSASKEFPAATASCPCLLPQDLTYKVINSQDKKERISLLEDVSGYILPSEMTALVGALWRAASPGASCPPQSMQGVIPPFTKYPSALFLQMG